MNLRRIRPTELAAGKCRAAQGHALMFTFRVRRSPEKQLAIPPRRPCMLRVSEGRAFPSIGHQLLDFRLEFLVADGRFPAWTSYWSMTHAQPCGT